MKLRKLKVNNKMRDYDKYEPPQPINKLLPPTYNIILSCSPKGGGKSYNCVELLTAYENSGFKNSKGEIVQMRTIWVSGGTSQSKQNSILNTLKSLHKDDRIDVDTNMDSKMKEIYEQLLTERDEIEAYNDYRATFKKFLKNRSLLNMTDDELRMLEYKNYIDPADDPEVPKDADGNILYNPRMVFLILDDLISTDAYGTKRNNFLNKLAVKSRHESKDLVGLNLFFIAQSFKAIPPLIRKQTDLFVLLKSASRNYIIDAIAEEVGSHFCKKELELYYDEIMKIDYGSLILSIHKKERPETRIRMGWDMAITRDPKYLF
jgi:hypothetical protein